MLRILITYCSTRLMTEACSCSKVLGKNNTASTKADNQMCMCVGGWVLSCSILTGGEAAIRVTPLSKSCASFILGGES